MENARRMMRVWFYVLTVHLQHLWLGLLMNVGTIFLPGFISVCWIHLQEKRKKHKSSAQNGGRL